VVLLFTKVDLFSSEPDFPDVPVGLDANEDVEILRHLVNGTPTFFPAISLGSLAAFNPNNDSDSTTITVRYIVGGNLPIEGNNLVVPPLSVAGVVNPTVIPEPGTLVFVGSGLAALAALRTRRWK
jgi:hypothetical protein